MTPLATHSLSAGGTGADSALRRDACVLNTSKISGLRSTFLLMILWKVDGSDTAPRSHISQHAAHVSEIDQISRDNSERN